MSATVNPFQNEVTAIMTEFQREIELVAKFEISTNICSSYTQVEVDILYRSPGCKLRNVLHQIKCEVTLDFFRISMESEKSLLRALQYHL
jgi:hypothetical protein